MEKPWPLVVLGKPWEFGSRGPDRFDCYGLLYWVKKHYYGEEIPFLADLKCNGVKGISEQFAAHQKEWEEIPEPVDGCAVGLSQVRAGMHHCGIWTDLDGGMVVHAHDNACVRAQSIQSLKLYGWATISFYKLKKTHAENNLSKQSL